MERGREGRTDGRALDEPREIEVIPRFLDGVPGSVLYRSGRTRILAVASLEEGAPSWLGDDLGWLTAEYALLPYSTTPRVQRAREEGRIDGRTREIQRLIGRSLRASLDRRRMPGYTIRIDCDVLQADGGTRTAAICGASIALGQLTERALADGRFAIDPRVAEVLAVSAGIVAGRPRLDLDYEEDSAAELDLNLVGTPDGRLVEIQGSSESVPIPSELWEELIALGRRGLACIAERVAPWMIEIEG
ncbi:MAG: ribonuclease PH [Planctomycetota bacterium]